jgi:4-amino-4-deoxy-L-arabinose transferase-like glycosyltransferase
MATITKKMLKVLALIWASVFCILIVLFVTIPGKESLIELLWFAQIAVIGLWALLYCIRGAVFVGEGVAERKRGVHDRADSG